MRTRWNRISAVFVTAMAFAAATPSALAQYQMSFSVYADIEWDGQNVDAWMTGTDNSTGCTHFNYETTGQLSPPSGGGLQGSSSGFEISIGLSFDDQDGVWYFDGWTDLECLCGPPIRVDWGTSLGLELYPKYVRIIGSPQYVQGPPAPYAFVVNREILDQFGQPLERELSVDESFSPNPPSGNCTSETVDEQDGTSNSGGTFGPDFYTLPGNASNPCSSTSTQSWVIGGYPIETTNTITWEYSGVSVVED